jgi:hypothetical protein
MAAAEPFDSASALRESNRRLLDRLDGFDDDDLPSDFLDEVEFFQLRAAATGVYLFALDDRGETQSLINFWLTVLFNGGRRPKTVILHEFDSGAARTRAGRAAPYKGLDAFQAEDTSTFFGRAATIRAMLDRLGAQRLLAVTGLSGSGKSSVVRAGLIPRLREGELAGSRDWHVLDSIVPGKDPVGVLSELAARVASSPARRLTEPRELVSALDTAKEVVLLSVDQFEEVFTLCEREEDRDFVLAALAGVAASGKHRHVVVITMRSEYDSRVETHPAFAELFAAGRIQIGALSARELRAAIEQPAAQVGVGFESGLAEELVQRVLGEPAGLPLLQFTLLELWKRRTADNKLGWEAYAELGGSPREILARRATQVYESFETQQDRTFSHRIFLALAEIGAGLEPTGRRVTRAELERIGSRDSVDHVLAVWQENGLIRISPPGPIVPASQVEVAHEALIRNWDLLVGWIEDHFAQTRRRRVLTEQALAWKEGAHDTLLGELSLKEAEGLADLDEAELDYVAASRKEVDRQYRNLRRRNWIGGAVAAGSLLLLFFALWQAGVARDQAYLALKARTLAGEFEERSKIVARNASMERAASEARSRRAAAESRRDLAALMGERDRVQTEYSRIRAQQTGLKAEYARLLSARTTATRDLAGLTEERRLAKEELDKIEGRARAAEAILDRLAATTAQERPAIQLRDLAAKKVPGVWGQLAANDTRPGILEAAESVGRMRYRTPQSAGFATAFMVADGIAAVLLPAGAGEPSGWSLDFSDAPGLDASRSFEAQRVVGQIPISGDGDPALRLVLVEMARTNAAGHVLPPPLPLAEVTGTGRAAISRLQSADPQVGQFTPDPGSTLYLVGYPMVVDENPISGRVLGNASGVKRVQPGFLLGASGGEVTIRKLRYDASTFPGNMGSPIFDLQSGGIIGIHWGGPPAGQQGAELGKFGVSFDAWLLRKPPLRQILLNRPNPD